MTVIGVDYIIGQNIYIRGLARDLLGLSGVGCHFLPSDFRFSMCLALAQRVISRLGNVVALLALTSSISALAVLHPQMTFVEKTRAQPVMKLSRAQPTFG